MALPLDPVTLGVEVEEDVVVPVLPHTATLTLAERLAAELRCCGDVQDVRVHDLLQVASSIKAGVLQDCGMSSQLVVVEKSGKLTNKFKDHPRKL